MAIAPVNKFISLVVPVAPGEQKLYEVPTGASSLVLYAQVANVGIGTYPTVTFIQRRTQRSTGSTRDIRVIKDIEIPPNDALILIDGRMVLEKTPLIIDSLYISGIQSGINTISNVIYDEPTGIITATTMSNHGFNVGDQITLAGIAFTCPDNTAGITTTIFPDPQKSYTVDEVINPHKFSSLVGGAKGYKHVYNPAVHRFIRAKQDALSRTTWDAGASKYTPTAGTYDGKTGIVKLTVKDKGLDIIQTAGSITPTGAAYDGNVGILTITKTSHGFNDWDLVKFDDGALTFKCTMDGNVNEKTYPRYGQDPMSGVWKKVTKIDDDNFKVFVGKTPFDFYEVTAAQYDPTAGIATLTVGTHDVVAGVTSVRLAPKSIQFTCAKDSHAGIHTYPRPNGYGGASSDDPAYNTAVSVASTTDTTISLNVGPANDGTAGIHTFVAATKLQPTNASYNPSTGALQLTVNSHLIETGDAIKIDNGSITFSCDYGCQVGVASHRAYPRSTDPASDKWLIATKDDGNNFTVNVGSAGGNTDTHHFVSATAGITRSVVKIGGAYTHTAVPGSFAANGVKKSTTKVGIVTESLIFSCSQDGFKTKHAYPRASDPVAGIQTGPTEVDCNNISFYVGISTAGGLVAPLQMEFLASILENSNA